MKQSTFVKENDEVFFVSPSKESSPTACANVEETNWNNNEFPVF